MISHLRNGAITLESTAAGRSIRSHVLLPLHSGSELPSHSVHRLLHWNENGPDTCDVEAELECGCVLRKTVARDRLVLTVDGKHLLVGKFPCPVQHPVGRRATRG